MLTEISHSFYSYEISKENKLIEAENRMVAARKQVKKEKTLMLGGIGGRRRRG